MGQLVFQAALGGQVNLVGPNTASTFNLNVPAASDTLVARATTDTLTNKTLTSPVISGGTIDNAVIGGTTTAAGSFTTLSASSTVSGTGFSTYLASPPAIGGTTAAAGSFTTLSYTSTLTGGTGIVNLGSGQFYKDASGNVGIGTASPYAQLSLGSASSLTNYQGALFGATLPTGSGSWLEFSENSTNGSSFRISKDSTTGVLFNTNSKAIGFKANGYSTAVSAANVVIDTSGNVGIGTTTTNGVLNISYGNISPNGSGNMTGGVIFENGFGGYSFHFGGGSTYGANWINSAYSNNSGTAAPLAFATGATERMRIDSSGNLLVGGTSQLGTSIASFYGGGTGVISMRNTASTAGRYWKSGPDSGGSYLVYNDANTGMYMLYGGTSWTSSSDERTKTTLVPFENALEKVCTLRAGTGRYLKDEETVSRSFLIAQDVQKVLPEAVNVQNDEIGTLGLQYTDVIPLLVAAIKELNTTITQLTNRITALENK